MSLDNTIMLFRTINRLQFNMLQKLLGYADLTITVIYANVLGNKELEIATKMWTS